MAASVPLRVAFHTSFVVTLLASAPVVAQEVDVTSTTVIGWHGDNDHDPNDTQNYDDNYGEALERLNLSVSQGQIFGNLRLDLGTYFSAPPKPDPLPPALDDRYLSYVNPEKVWVSYTQRDYEVTAGDSYVSFGRGLALSMRKIDEFGVDSTVRGARLLVHRGPVNATLIGGFANNHDVDQATGRIADPDVLTHNPLDYDRIFGAQASYRLNGVDIGGRAVGFQFYTPLGFTPPGAEPEHYQDQWYTFGPSLDAPHLTDKLGVYLEGIGQSRNDGSRGDGTGGSGYGLYGAATYNDGPTTLVIEAKAYGDLEVIKPKNEFSEFDTIQYYNPPTLERVTQILDRPQEDIVGGRLRLDYSASPTTLLYGNYALFRDYFDGGYQVENEAGEIEQQPASIHDPYAGIELRWDQMRSRAKAQVGYRFAIADMVNQTVRRDRHIEIEVVQRLTDRLSLVGSVNHLNRKEVVAPFVNSKWREGTWQLGLQWSPILSVGAMWDYTSDATEDTGYGEFVPGLDIGRHFLGQQNYLSGLVEWRPHEMALVRLLAGATHGGLRCVSNVCRYFPPFEGVKLTATIRY